MKGQIPRILVALLLVVPAGAQRKVPIILDTDIGTDIDDAFALALALSSPEIDLRAVTTVSADAYGRALIACRFLEAVGRGDIPVAAGRPQRPAPEKTGQYAYGLDASFRKRPVSELASEYIYQRLKAEPGVITLVTAGDLTNAARVITDHPEAKPWFKRIVLMGGAVRSGYNGKPPVVWEWNIRSDIKGAQVVFSSGVPITMAPLDATIVRLEEPFRNRIFGSGAALGGQLHELYKLWGKVRPVLFDPVAVTLSFDESCCTMENLRIEVDNEGFTREVKGTPNARVATSNRVDDFLNWYVDRVAPVRSGDLPIPPDLEEKLKQRGFTEKFLPVQAEELTPKPNDTKRGWLVYHRDRNFEVLPNSKPAPSEALDVLRVVATPGEIESEPFSAYALRDVGALGVYPQVMDARGASAWLTGAMKVEDVLFHPVQLRAKDTPVGEKTFVRYPVFVRPASAHTVRTGTSRLYWVTVQVPESVPPGTYRAAVRLADEDGNEVDLPVEVEVLPFRLTTKGIPSFGAFLSGRTFAKGEWAFMKRYGMDALQWFWNQHPIRILNDNGNVKLDFTEYDTFVQGMKDAGMRGPLVLSLGNSWLGFYEIQLAKAFGLRLMTRELEGRKVTLMDMTDSRWEKPYLEGLRQIFAHAKEAGWPALALLINDEPTKHIMAYHPYRYHLIKKHFPDIPVYGVFFQPEKDPGPLLHSSDIMVANRDLERIKRLSVEFGKRFWTYNNITADQSFGKNRLLYGQIPSYYESEVMWFWCWNYYVGNPWDDFDGWSEEGKGPPQSDADWVAVYPSVDGVEPVRTLAIEAAREAIDDVRYIKTLESLVAEKDPARWQRLRAEVRSRQKAMFDGIVLNNRIYSDRDFFTTAKNDDVEKLRAFVIARILENLKGN